MAKKDKGLMTGDPVTYPIPSPAGGVQMETFIPWTLVKHGVKKQVLTPLDAPEAFREEAVKMRQSRKAAQDLPLIRALGLAHYWQRLLDDGTYRSITEIAAVEGLDLGQASRIARLMQLAPEIVEDCLAGGDNGLALEHLNRRSFPVDWAAQRLMLLIPRE
jgi:hypothetical protein